MSYSLTSEADYLKQNTLKLKVRLEEQQLKDKQEQKQSKKWQQWQQEDRKLTDREWFKKRTRLELLELMKLGRYEFEYEFQISSLETRKCKLLDCLLQDFSIFKLNKMRKEYLNRRLSNALDTRKIEIAKQRSQHNYIQRRLVEIFRHWLTPQKIFHMIIQETQGEVVSYDDCSSAWRCLEWTSPFSLKTLSVHRYPTTVTEIVFRINTHSWETIGLVGDGFGKKVLMVYNECIYDYILSTGVRHMETQARWVISHAGGANRMRSLGYQRKQAELNRLAPVTVFLQDKCPNWGCNNLLFWHQLKPSTSVYGQTSLHCDCHHYMVRDSGGQPVIFGMSAEVNEDASITLHRKCQCKGEVRSDRHWNPTCARYLVKGSCNLHVDLMPLINQDLQREKWHQFIQSDRLDLQNTPARSLVNEYIGLV